MNFLLFFENNQLYCKHIIRIQFSLSSLKSNIFDNNLCQPSPEAAMFISQKSVKNKTWLDFRLLALKLGFDSPFLRGQRLVWWVGGRVGRDQFFGTRPRPRNQTYENSLRDRDREKVDADFQRREPLQNQARQSLSHSVSQSRFSSSIC